MPRYFAVSRIAWGKQHLTAGDELLDPAPAGVLVDHLVKAGLVRREEDKPAKNTYARRDMTAERPTRQRPAPKAEATAEPAAEPKEPSKESVQEGGAVGAMTTQSVRGAAKKPE